MWAVLKCHTNQTKGRIMTVIPAIDTTRLWVSPWHPVSQDATLGFARRKLIGEANTQKWWRRAS